jgi:genome maintenance exonuclease 1
MKTFNYVAGLPKLSPLPTEEIDGRRFYVTPDGKKYPSITTVLGHFKKQQLKEWRDRIGHEEAGKITRRASTRGTKFHNLMEKYLRNENDLFENIMPDMKQSFKDIQIMVDKIDNIHYIECPLYSHKLGVAGRTDVIAEFDGKLSVIDFKTSLREKKESHIENYFEQATAYSIMYEELTNQPIEQIVVMISVDNLPEPQLFVKSKKDYINSLVNKIATYRKENTHVS